MAKEKNNAEKNVKKDLVIANVYEQEALKGGNKKDLVTRIVAIMKTAGQEKTKKGILMEKAVARQVNAMVGETGKKGRWKKYKNTGKDDQIKIELVSQ